MQVQSEHAEMTIVQGQMVSQAQRICTVQRHPPYLWDSSEGPAEVQTGWTYYLSVHDGAVSEKGKAGTTPGEKVNFCSS